MTFDQNKQITQDDVSVATTRSAKNAMVLARLAPGDVFTATMPTNMTNSGGVLFIEREGGYNWYNYDLVMLLVVARAKTLKFVFENDVFDPMVRSLYSNTMPGGPLTPALLSSDSELFVLYCVASKPHQNQARAHHVLNPGQVVMCSPEIIAVEHERIVIHG